MAVQTTASAAVANKDLKPKAEIRYLIEYHHDVTNRYWDNCSQLELDKFAYTCEVNSIFSVLYLHTLLSESFIKAYLFVHRKFCQNHRTNKFPKQFWSWKKKSKPIAYVSSGSIMKQLNFIIFYFEKCRITYLSIIHKYVCAFSASDSISKYAWINHTFCTIVWI